MEYGQFCPIAKATEIIGEKWTLLVVRELLMGGTRFSELQRGLSMISPTMLSKRLDTLEQHGLVMKKKITNQKGYEYFPTKSCSELLPIIKTLGATTAARVVLPATFPTAMKASTRAMTRPSTKRRKAT